jgi:cell shape-determining protein MreD
LERTLDTFGALSEMACRLIRVNALVMTILVAGASQVRTVRYLNPLTVGAVLLFVASALFAVVSYTSRRIEGGVGPAVLETTVSPRRSTSTGC